MWSSGENARGLHAVRVLSKAKGLTLDGTDPDQIAAAFAWAVERARAGVGPTLIELVSMRMCGHAHHDDMLYLGKEPPLSWNYPPVAAEGYVDRERYAYWATRDPIPAYAARLESAGESSTTASRLSTLDTGVHGLTPRRNSTSAL